MADGDYYASYADIQNSLMNTGLGVSGNTLFDANAIEIALLTSMNVMHTILNVSAKIATAPYTNTCRAIQIDVVKQCIIHARFFKEQNLTDPGILTAVSAGIQLNNFQLYLLNLIHDRLESV